MKLKPFKNEDELEKAFEYAKHQLALEGMHITEEEEKDAKAVLKGEMTREELIQKIKNESKKMNK